MTSLKMGEFCKLAERINAKFNIKPLLYGSLGLQMLVDEPLNADDIDVLVPLEYLGEKWELLCALMGEEGYALIDLHEHTFLKDETKISFAKIDDLKEYAGIDLSKASVIIQNNAEFMLLNLSQYLNVYVKSSEDSYRRNKNNSKDFEKIAIIKKHVGSSI